MATVTIQSTPSEPRQSSPVRSTVAYAGFKGSPRIDVFIYNQADSYPTSEEGWTFIGSVTSSGQSFDWNTEGLSAGSHYIAFVAWFGSVLAGHWLTDRGAQNHLQLQQIRIAQITAGPAPTINPINTGLPSTAPVPKDNPWIPNYIEQNQQQSLLIGGAIAAGIAALFLMRGKSGSDE